MTLDPSTEVWVDDRVGIGRSGIEGDGLVAGEHLPAGTVVMRLGGHLVPTAELDELIASSPVYVDTITVVEDRHLVLPPMTRAHYANHSCDPNLWLTGVYEIAARRDVRTGEELTIDYATISGAPGLDMPCACGALTCRGRVTSDDWRLPELQARYDGHWVPALAERITRSR